MSTVDASDALSSALFPKARRAVLGLLYAHPDQPFYLRQIVEYTGLGTGHVQREVQRLAAAGIIRRTARDRHVYFQADADCPIFADLRGLVTKTVGAAAVLRAALRPLRPRLAVAFIFGSVARGEERHASDLDLLVIGAVTFGEITGALRGAEAQLRREINASVYPPAEFRGKLARRNHFLTAVLKREKVFVVGDAHELGALLEEPVDS